jgi:hypothetical protein
MNGQTITQQSVIVEDTSVNQALLSRATIGKLVDTRALIGQQTSRSIFILDSNPSGAQIIIDGRAAGITPYQGLNHQRNKTVKVTLSVTTQRIKETIWQSQAVRH